MKHALITLALAAFIAAPIPAFAAAKGNVAAMSDFTECDTIAKDAPHDWTPGPTSARADGFLQATDSLAKRAGFPQACTNPH